VFLKDLTRWEGEQRSMYVDTRGFVTTGIGHLLKGVDQALKLPWYRAGTGKPATPAEVKAAFERLRQAWTDLKRDNPNANGLSAAKCGKLSDLILPEGLPVKLARNRLDTEFLEGLRRIFPGFDRFPMPAQRALVDMAYNLGVGKLESKFPALLAACCDGDFATAAAESHRSSSRKERNDVTHDLFMQAAQLQASLQPIGKGVRL
jgi:GH24 family phage-related lysozyme (muramidase)